MITQPAAPVRNPQVRNSPVSKKTLPKISQPSAESLLKSLIDHLLPTNAASPQACSSDAPETEEVIFDSVLDGDHYLLVRLPRATRPRVQLSPREQEIVRMVAQGHPNKIIADVLNISSWTVCTHLRRIFAKLGVTSRAAMVARILESGNGREHPQPAPEREPADTYAPKAPNSRLDAVRTASALAQRASVG